MTTASQMRLTPIVDCFVGEISGINLATQLDEQRREFLVRAHQDYPVLAIREQSLSTESFMAFGGVFGEFELDHHLPQFQDKDHPEIVYLTNRRGDGSADPAAAKRGAAWHADSTYKPTPCAHTALYAIEVPSTGGGTLFADMCRAYETLPATLRDAIDGRLAKHKFGAGPADGGVIPMTAEQEEMHPAVSHPMVRIDPITGKKSLYVNPLHVYGIVGMSQREAVSLLEQLFAHAMNPDFQYRHDYRVGDLVIWDQRRTWHRAEAAYSMHEHRLLMRAKIAAPG